MIMIGDSKRSQLPALTKFMKAVRRWLKSQFEGKWNDMRDSLPISIQYDGTHVPSVQLMPLPMPYSKISCGNKREPELRE